MNAAAYAFQTHALNLVSPQVSLRAEAVGKNARFGLGGHSEHAFVIIIQDGDTLRGGRKRLHQFSLALRDDINRTGAFRMDRTDIGHNANLRPGNIAQQFYFSGT
jgi:hypothetical protein